MSLIRYHFRGNFLELVALPDRDESGAAEFEFSFNSYEPYYKIVSRLGEFATDEQLKLAYGAIERLMGDRVR